MRVSAFVGRQVHLLMWERGIPQRSLCGPVPVTQSTLSKKIRGSVPWTVDEAAAAAEFLGVDVAELLPRKDSNLQPAGYWHSLLAVAA